MSTGTAPIDAVKDFEESIIPATHEAGHAVVAAYLRVPFKYATILWMYGGGGHVRFNPSGKARIFCKVRGRDEYKLRTQNELNSELAKRDRKVAISLLSARAAIDATFPKSTLPPDIETSYQWDEKHLKELADSLNVQDFPMWRRELLDEARRIVAIPQVFETIESVATKLIIRRTVLAQEIRATLRLICGSRA